MSTSARFRADATDPRVGARLRPAGLTRAGLSRALEQIGFPVLAIVVVCLTIVEAAHAGDLAVDFRGVSPAIRGLAHGVDPFTFTHEYDQYLWTVLAGWIMAPFAWLPHGYLIVVALEVLGVVVAPLLLGVRDWRLIALCLAWPTSVSSIQTGNITVLVTVLLAATWHDRARARAGLWAGLAVGVKLFAWPVLVWLAATRRWRALGLALGVQLVTLLITLPYISPGSYWRFELGVDRTDSGRSITLDALVRQLGGSPNAGQAVALAVGLAILWKGRRELGWVVVSMLVLSPVVWIHYFGLLVIPLGLWSSSRRVWCIPMLLVLAAPQGNGGLWRTAAALGVAGIAAGVAWLSLPSGKATPACDPAAIG